MAGPIGDRLIRVDMTAGNVSIDPYPEDWTLLGGRALSARILLEECDPDCDPLGPDNVLVLAPGVLAGTMPGPDASHSASQAAGGGCSAVDSEPAQVGRRHSGGGGNGR